MTDAGVTAQTTRVRPGEAELNRITGARTPSGVPVILPVPAAAEPPKRSGGAGRNRSGRPARGRRRSTPTSR